MADRPLLVTIVAALCIILGLIGLAGGALLLGVNATVGWVTIIIGLITFIVGCALWDGWTIAWYLGLILSVVNIIFAVYNIVANDNWSGILEIIVAVIVIWYLLRPNVKEFFKV